jgi:hypothetical protein
MPTCGLYCSTAIGRSKKRIKLQCIIPIKIGDKVIETIFLVIPNLISDLIIGCDFLSEWEASIDFERCILLIKGGMGELITPFIKEEVRKVVSNNVSKEEQLLEETFFVECIDLQETSVARVRNVSDKYSQLPLCSEAQDCEECYNRLNGNYISLDPDMSIDYINECIRLSQIDTTELKTYEHTMIAKVNENHMLNCQEKQRLYQVLIKNKKVFDNRLGKCNSYTHKFEVTDKTPFNHKCRTIPSSLINKVDETIKKC